MVPKILIIEDRELILGNLVHFIKEINPDERERHGIDKGDEGLLIHTAGWVSQAMHLLQAALDSSEPYDVVVLDLSLPQEKLNPGEQMVEKPNVGLEMIDFMRRTHAAKEIIVYSAFDKLKYVRPAFRQGAIDFIAKGKGRDNKVILQQAFLAAWDRILAEEAGRTFEERFAKLVPHAQKGLAHWFSGCFSRLIQSIAHEIEGTKTNLNDRLGLDMIRDEHDPLVWHVSMIQKSLKLAKEEWTSLQASLSESEEPPKIIVLENELNAILEDVLACLTLKRAKTAVTDGHCTRVISFSDDVSTIVRELIIGGLIEEPDRTGVTESTYVQPTIDIAIDQKDEKAEICVKDNLTPIPPSVANAINQGFSVAIDDSFGRAWGLSAAQHAALRGGGRLVVKSSHRGNTISFFIPLAN